MLCLKKKNLRIKLPRKAMRKWHIQKNKHTMLLCSKCDFTGETDQKLNTHIVVKHIMLDFSAVQEDKYECNECTNYFNMREVLIKHVKKRGKCKSNV